MINISLIGPRLAGKTVFIYLMREKLIDCFAKGKAFDDIKGIKSSQFDISFKKAFEKNNWPPETITSTERPLKLALESQSWLRSDVMIKVPDIRGDIIAKHIASPNEDDGEFNEYVDYLKSCIGLIFVIDSNYLISEDRETAYDEHLGFYVEFIEFYRNFIRNSQTVGQKNVKVCIVLGKADLMNDSNKLNERALSGEELVRRKLRSFYSDLIDIFEKKNLKFSWHSSIGSTILLNRGDIRMPDYDFFLSLNPETYVEDFIKFIKSI